MTETYYPGYSEDIQLAEYEAVKKVINKKYKTNNTALEIRSEFEEAYNKIFSSMIADHPKQPFEIIWVIMDHFNIDEVKAVRYLNKENYAIVRDYAKEHCHTPYYENIETDLKQKKIDKKLAKRKETDSLKYKKSIKTIMDLFE